mmetsp:Transcript_40493/g.89981  ORF Transcript_40493/g.89981 Transcript_40493/m.89981 type:complete len:520 (+) Transcript_40493:158-1717(+)|eukprot:CAMPEP_0202905360 /NCGR_PEP_ID=MMETSP1392-20130828/33828_1 /ASSEMBLY_ACC=CAM_ASM_000868 /TAXON_ID=225041 /ORGANISM="Chlamydomonas chlamydogama, Strain SAG 11-48b" /LENGTH=519 /DNA_ID=CAMNT_0049593409 /DNA_START=89 /DNA_END=1648 /DNA_ORIENTATION=-
MVGVILELPWGSVNEDDDRRSIRSTSTVASTVGTGVASLASRIAALNIEFSDKLQEGLGDEIANSILEEEDGLEDGDQEDDGARSERTTVATGEVGNVADDEAEETSSVCTAPLHYQRTSLTGTESPDNRPPPFQICSRLFTCKGNIQLKRLTIVQVEELRQHGYVVVDDFISADIAQQVKTAALLLYNKGRMTDAGRMGIPSDTARPERVTPRGDLVMWLSVGRPPADSSPLAQLLVAFSELQQDLLEFVKLRRSAEYQVSVHPASSPGVGRHRDAVPDGGRREGHRRITAMVCCNPNARREDGGAITIWPPRRAPMHAHGHPALGAYTSGGGSVVGSERQGAGGQHQLQAHRRSLTGSDAGTSFSESDTCSFRSHYMGMPLGAAAGGAPSMSSSMWAEAASTLEQDHDNASVAESIDSYMHHALHAGLNPGALLEGRGAGGMASTSAAAGTSVRGGAGAGAPPERAGLEWVDQDGEMVLQVSPLAGRLVLFLSGAVDHAHQPVSAGAEAVAVTAWYQ